MQSEIVQADQQLPDVAHAITTFNPIFFSSDVDVSRFERSDFVMPGMYRVDVFINQTWQERRDIELRTRHNGQTPVVCLSSATLEQWGVEWREKKGTPSLTDELCVDIAAHIPAATVKLDKKTMRFDLSVPQRYLRRQYNGSVPTSEWDKGINAGFLNYRLHYSHIATALPAVRDPMLFLAFNPDHQHSYYASLDTGLNVAGWRLRNWSSYSTNSREPVSHWQRVLTYAQHDVTRLRSQLTIGETISSDLRYGDGMSFTGVKLASDDRMLPGWLRGYAPRIRGMADTQARVIIRQHGVVIYTTTVAPGEFRIDDLILHGGGQLQVTIDEADGRQKQFSVLGASDGFMLRPSASRYSLSLGKLRDERLPRHPLFGRVNYEYGLENGVTLFAGATLSGRYQSGLGGLAFGTSLGTMSFDVTQSRSTPETVTPPQIGYRLRGNYSVRIKSENSSISMVAERYSRNYHANLSQALKHTHPSYRIYANLNKPIMRAHGNYGNLYIRGSVQGYRDHMKTKNSVYVGYSRTFTRPYFLESMTLSLARSRDGVGRYNNQFYVGVHVPLGRSGDNRPRLATQFSTASRHRRSTLTTMLSGNAGADGQLYYNVNAGYYHVNETATEDAGAMLSYAGKYAKLSGSASSGNQWNQQSLGLSGGVLAHSGGVLVVPETSETMAIVNADNMAGATINGSGGGRNPITINRAGYAVVPYLSPYQRNEVAIDPKGSSLNVELASTSRYVVPRAGAIIKLKFSTAMGRALLLHLSRSSGKPIPVGASVINTQNNELISFVAQGGKLFSRKLQHQMELVIRWGKAERHQCRVAVILPELTIVDSHQPIHKVALPCIDTLAVQQELHQQPEREALVLAH